nr:cyclopentanone monooxygenase [Colletotrichum truncatum]KAF6793932.1 cyclopentanone monooxygenase [Colletotrichum truncatum]
MADYQIGSEHPQSLISDFVIVGTGFSGCYALHKIRELGYSAKILEAGSDFGGVWHVNKYPGAALRHISLACPKSGKRSTSRRDTLGMKRFGDEVKYDSKSKRWLFRTEKGRRIESRFAIFACGSFNKPYIPAFPNLNAFRGLLIHPSAWPEGVKLDGKKIGIIGQGASGLQLVQELAKQDILLTVFIREPCHTLPMQQRRLSYRESEELKNYYDGIFSKAKFGSSSAIGYNQNSDFYHQASGSDRVTLYQRLWDRGGFGLTLSNYRDIMYDKTANSSLYEFWMRKTRARMSNPEKMDIVAPLKQSQWFGAKRVNLEMDYYEMLDRPNVKLVDLKKTPLKSFSRNGVVTEGHDSTLDHHELDVMILATGYDSVTGSLLGMNIHDRHGLRLEEKWKDGISTDLGMLVPEMPNAFLLYGPQGPITQTNAPSFIEL